MKTVKTFASILTLISVALVTLGFVSPQGATVFLYQHLLTVFYVFVGSGLAAVGLFDAVGDHIHGR